MNGGGGLIKRRRTIYLRDAGWDPDPPPVSLAWARFSKAGPRATSRRGPSRAEQRWRANDSPSVFCIRKGAKVKHAGGPLPRETKLRQTDWGSGQRHGGRGVSMRESNILMDRYEGRCGRVWVALCLALCRSDRGYANNVNTPPPK